MGRVRGFTRYVLVVGAVLAGFSLVASPAAAQRTQFDILSFEPPAGWAPDASKAGVRVYTSPEGGDHRCVIALWESGVSKGNAGADFETEWRDLMKSEASASSAESSVQGDGWTLLTRRYHARDANGFEFDAVFLTFSGHGRVTSVRMDVRQPTCQPAARAFGGSLRATLAVAPAPPPAPPTTTGSIVGVWRAIGTTTEMMGITNASGTGFSMMTTSATLKVKLVTFLADGSFTVAVPADGVLDVSKSRQENAAFWGVYTMQGGRGLARLGASRADTLALDVKGALTYDRWVYHRVPSRVTSALEGTYTAEVNPSAYQGSMSREPTISFTAAGRFEDQGALYYVRHVRGYNTDHQDDQPGGGTYALKEYTLSLAYDDGRRLQILVLDPDGTPGNSPRQFQLGGLRWVTKK